jgi:Gpi18-like mannosyltransferase
MHELAPTAKAARGVRTSVSDIWWYAAGVTLLGISLFVRLISYPVITSDYTYFVSKWFDALGSHPGLSAFAEPFANYAPLYLYMLKALTYVPVSSLVSAKTLSFAFDIAIAVLACLAMRLLKPEWSKEKLFFVFALMLSIPTVVLNSSLWAQSDAVYAAFVLGSALGLFASAPLVAVISFGIALSIKLQAIFFLPVLAGCLVARGEVRRLLWIPVIFIAALIPAWQ